MNKKAQQPMIETILRWILWIAGTLLIAFFIYRFFQQATQ
jgi:hypothetical protein